MFNYLEKNWKKEIARDILALGSIVFYIMVIARALIGPYFDFLYQLIIAAVVLLVLSLIIRKYEGYIARGIILVFFTIIFYQEIRFSIFASALFLAMIFSSHYIKKDIRAITKGLILGIIAIVVGYYGQIFFA